MSCTVEIICIGNELLIGKILNTNAQWLAKRITSLGGKVKRIYTVEDDLDEVSSTLNESLLRTPTFIITTGGLGPTFDDKTLEAIAKALNKRLVLNEEAFNMIKEKYRQYETSILKKIELTPARVKMAILPRLAKPIKNPVGTAPAVLIKFKSSKIITLPGVPTELEAIFNESIAPMIKRATKGLVLYEKSLNITAIIESELAPLLDEVMHDNPYVYLKSHPKAAEPIPKIELHMMTTAKSKEDAKIRVETVAEQISKRISEHGGVVLAI